MKDGLKLDRHKGRIVGYARVSSVDQTEHANSKQSEQSAASSPRVALRLFRADSAPAALALLTEHLGEGERRLPADELYERVDEDFEELRGAGFEPTGNAQYYVTQWRNAVFLVRRPSSDSREETLELSSHALHAVRFVQELQTPCY